MSAVIYRFVLITVLIVLVIVVGALFYFNSGGLYSNTPEEYLIAGVPYWGSFVGTRLSSSGATAAYTLLQYWGDGRVTLKDVARAFPAVRKQGDTEVLGTNFNDLIQFFKEHGYSARIHEIDSINDFYSFVARDVPVVISQSLSREAPSSVTTMRVLIGYSETKEVLTFHDHLFGNNYEISYPRFEELWEGHVRKVLVVKPSFRIKQELSGPDTTKLYPERLLIMDNPGIRRIIIKWATIDTLKKNEVSAQDIAQVWENIVGDNAFGLLHPAAQVSATFKLAQIYVNDLGRYQSAITLLENVTAPLLELDLNAPVGEWEIRDPEIYTSKWYTRPKQLLEEAKERLENE